MKKVYFTLLFTIVILMSAKGQYNNYIRISGDIGIVTNSERDKKFGAGGTIAWLTVDNYVSSTGNNFISLSIKGFNNPYREGKLVSSILNNADDGFNYIMPLVGYRITKIGFEDGLFFEPRIGAAFGGNYAAFAFAPLAGYSFQNIELSIFVDMGFGSKNSAIRKKNFVTPGVSIAYNLGM